MRNKIISFGFIFILLLFFIINIFQNDKEISVSERRVLTQLPEISKFTEDFEEYAVDQFWGRDFFRKVKNIYNTNILLQKDTNGYFEKDGAIYKIEYPLKPENIKKSTDKINQICNLFLKNMNVYYSIIPDKNYYLQDDKHLKMDYNELFNIVNENLKSMKYIDITDKLVLEDFYRTDIHWKQENLLSLASYMQSEIGKVSSIYNKELVGNYYGTYYGHIATFNEVKPDTMYILNNDLIENCTTYNFETNEISKIYDRKSTNDKYDIYLSGATSLIEINNPNAQNENELLLFRDSFGSSIAPLLVHNYKKVTLIDIRYISYEILDEYIKFGNQDVLFLYSSLVLNQNIFK